MFSKRDTIALTFRSGLSAWRAQLWSINIMIIISFFYKLITKLVVLVNVTVIIILKWHVFSVCYYLYW